MCAFDGSDIFAGALMPAFPNSNFFDEAAVCASTIFEFFEGTADCAFTGGDFFGEDLTCTIAVCECDVLLALGNIAPLVLLRSQQIEPPQLEITAIRALRSNAGPSRVAS